MTETRYIEGQGRYALAEMIGRGGFATVWRARTLAGRWRNRDVAVKIIPVYNAGERSRALREGQIAENLKHKNIVRTVEVIPGDHEIYLVTEYVPGLPLDEAARAYDTDEITDCLTQILEALVYAHGEGIIHRDIKPQNALVDNNGRVKLTDFGVAFRAGDTRLTRVGFAVGTPGYIAPEILDGADPTALTDIYAVGATARTLLARQPYEPPRRLREFVDRATSPNPAHRPQNAWAAMKLLTGRRMSAGGLSRTGAKAPVRLSENFKDGALRLVNGLTAGFLGYVLGSSLLMDGGSAVGIAAGLGVLAYLLPRLGALGVIVALAVILLQNNASLGLSMLVPVLGGLWVAGAGAASGDVRRLPLGPALAVLVTAFVGLGAGLPLLFGALMRPLAAGLSAAAGAFAMICYELTVRDAAGPLSEIPYIGARFDTVPLSLRVGSLWAWGGNVVEFYPRLPFLLLLWAGMALAVSLGEWSGRWIAGLVAAVGGGVVGYALLVSERSADALPEAVTSLGLAAIIYGVLRYLVAWARG